MTEPSNRPSSSLAKGVPSHIHGSEFDRFKGREARKPRKLKRRLRNLVTHPANRFFAWLAPYVYWGYMWLVWWTSRVEDDADPIRRGLARHGRAVALLWHQEVVTVGYGYRDFSPHTLASTGNQGAIITRMLEYCGFLVFRGGTSEKRARRRQVLGTMIRHMREWEGKIAYGITVDGSHGPAFELKPGGPMIARACRAPVYLARTFYQRRIEAATWDRTTCPLPFNRIRVRVIGPYWISPDASAAEFERFCAHLQEELRELAHLSYRELEGWPPPRIEALLPAGWRPGWEDGTVGLKFGPHDLQEETWPAWAHLAGRPDRDRQRRAARRAP